MHSVFYWLVRAVVAFIQAWPLTWLARAGRLGGTLVYLLDVRHRRVTCRNLAMCFPAKSAREIKELAKENFRRIGENFTCAVKTASMPMEQIRQYVSFDVPQLTNAAYPRRRVVVAIGHFGNFELYARFGEFLQGYQCATTYRGLRQPYLNRVLQWLREHSECRFFERRSDAAALKRYMQQENAIVGLLCDQHAGNNGIPLLFLGNECSTSAAPALFALRYDCLLLTGFCYRTALAKWRIESGPEIATHANGRARAIPEIMKDINRAFEEAVMRDPANWFWVHNRWKLKIRKAAVGSRPTVRTESTPIVGRSAPHG